ncbi:hypothetical protein [Caulobacter sp. NIBR1757]|uniref:hypothetical protein n=1 Tax=Caulobacter sp. NIBR1757 TaxID=3016000 RepID=UPI0022F14486|nr:hypothetical protein [Caulobacter sp. NIBR1757]WGM40151.1 hypothetical protein AMEJIAPC_03092 [Caulobacter sp. NIBR1757]
MADDAVNPQIVDAVTTSTEFALGFADLGTQSTVADTRISAGVAISYDKAAQAAAISVQDAADYQRNMLSISTAVQGKAMAMILAGTPTEGALVAYALGLVSSFAAPIAAAVAAESVTLSLKTFPRA